MQVSNENISSFIKYFIKINKKYSKKYIIKSRRIFPPTFLYIAVQSFSATHPKLFIKIPYLRLAMTSLIEKMPLT